MWLDFNDGGAGGVGAFAFPERRMPMWTELWRALVDQVSVTPDEASKQHLLDEFAARGGVRTLGFVNAHALNCCVGDRGFAADLLNLDHIVRDGIGVHALYRMIGARSGLNLNGTDLLPELLDRFAGRRVALFGTQLHLVEQVAADLRRDLRCEVVVADGFQPDGYYLERVASEAPALVVLGMGMPKQERVARLMKHGLRQDVAIVCGGAILDFMSGHVQRAPHWMRRNGLEWMYRLSIEPKRLFGRYVIGNPLFVLRSLVLTGHPPSAAPKPRPLPAPPADPALFGIGGPLAGAPATVHEVAMPPVAPRAAPIAVARLTATEFSANRPVALRDDLFGREADVGRLLSWVVDQGGNALIYGPRGYGKTSLVRVFGEIADSRGHVVLYVSCSRRVDFSALMRLYLDEIPGAATSSLPDSGRLTVQQVAARLASVTESLIIILDEFDRIERDDTREDIVELIKDVSDLTASVRFVLVGVATDATAILGYHPSVHRCITCVPLTRLSERAIDELFRRKAAAGGLTIAEAALDDVVRLSAGSAYHAQLIGQKLASRAQRTGRARIDAGDVAAAVGEIVDDAILMDAGLARLAGEMRASASMRGALAALAVAALADPNDLVRDNAAAPCRSFVAAGLLQRIDSSDAEAPVFRFPNAFLPQLVLMIEHLAATPR